jgi:hypothetical protein
MHIYKRFYKRWVPAVILILCTSALATIGYVKLSLNQPAISGAPPYGAAENDIPSLNSWEVLKQNWIRPNEPPKVGLQIGHLENEKVPEELKNLRGNTGASAGGYTETEVNRAIAEKTAALLKAQGIKVDILPATIPPDYWAGVFIAIHADGSTNPRTSGFKIAAPWRDLTGKSAELVTLLENSYATTTGLEKDENITRNMRGYYAFNWWRYEHSIHPMTTAAIVETGFLTNSSDRQLIAERPELPAQAIAEGVTTYLKQNGLIGNS